MTNILEAVYNIVTQKIVSIKTHYYAQNRANSMGEALENYIKDAFAGTLLEEDAQERMRLYSEQFSWLGNQNHPPDIMIKGGDAIEVKKTQKANNSLALNSSFPKATLQASSPMITQECRVCEAWEEKDIIYCIGHVSSEALHSLWMLYGTVYAANHPTYQRIKDTISGGIRSIPDVEFAETKELGRVNRVDPLGITNLRIRGMWQIQNPRKVFDYLHQPTGADFELVVLIPEEKYFTFPKKSRQKLEQLNEDGFKLTTVQVPNPNNPAQLIACKQVVFLFSHS